ncbi:unnamed protein product [Closterium sp. Naga37s-1]|nr:unnamed protein product [Closterium sp. Naga37s-1]
MKDHVDPRLGAFDVDWLSQPRHAPAKRLERRTSLSPLAQLQEFYQVQSAQEQRPRQGTGERMWQGTGEQMQQGTGEGKGEREGKQQSQLLLSQQRQSDRNQIGAVTRLGRRLSIDLADVAAARAAAAAAKESPSARGYETSNKGGAATAGSSPADGGARRLHLSNRQTSGDWAAHAGQGKSGAQNTRAQAHEQRGRSLSPLADASGKDEHASPRLCEGGASGADPAHAQYFPHKSPRAARLPLSSPHPSADESAGPPIPTLDPTQAGMLFSAVLHRGKAAGSPEAAASAEARRFAPPRPRSRGERGERREAHKEKTAAQGGAGVDRAERGMMEERKLPGIGRREQAGGRRYRRV